MTRCVLQSQFQPEAGSDPGHDESKIRSEMFGFVLLFFSGN